MLCFLPVTSMLLLQFSQSLFSSSSRTPLLLHNYYACTLQENFPRCSFSGSRFQRLILPHYEFLALAFPTCIQPPHLVASFKLLRSFFFTLGPSFFSCKQRFLLLTVVRLLQVCSVFLLSFRIRRRIEFRIEFRMNSTSEREGDPSITVASVNS